MGEVADGGALAQKFRVGCHVKIGIRIGFLYHPPHFPRGANRHRGFIHHHRIALQMRGNISGGTVDELQVGVAVAAPGRGAYGDKHQVGVFDSTVGFGSEVESSGADIARDQVIQSRLVNRYFSAVQCVYTCRVFIQACYLVPEFGKAGTGNQPHVARANHNYIHE
jgi:hypothetical protein